MAYDNAALVRRLFDEVWSKGNLNVADELLASGCTLHDPIMGDTKGPDSLKAQVKEYRSAYPDLRFVIDDLIVSADKVFVRWTGTGTHKGPIMGVPPTGKTYAIEGMTSARLANGKILESYSQWDTVKFLQNLGVMPPLGVATTRTEPAALSTH
jgi:steroid delta-isomerase-like uncharacterized protein